MVIVVCLEENGWLRRGVFWVMMSVLGREGEEDELGGGEEVEERRGNSEGEG